MGEGAAIALFNREFASVIENTLDVNTDLKQGREVNLRVKLSDDREGLLVSIEVTSTLSSPKDVQTFLYVGGQEGLAMAIEHNPKQGRLFEPCESPSQRRSCPRQNQ